MKNHREISGIFANILIVVLVLVFIVLGLNKIGVYDLPDGIEKIIGTYESDGEETDNQEHSKNFDDIAFDSSVEKSEIYELDYTAASRLFENISATRDYEQRVTYALYYGDVSLERQVSLTRKNSLYSAYVIEGNDRIVKEIIETDAKTTVIDHSSNPPVEAVFERGNFDISDECGFVLTVEDFLNSGYALSEAAFSQFDNELGTCVKITFDKTMGNIKNTESLTVSLDFGAVVESECYENDKLVYSMKTQKLSR